MTDKLCTKALKVLNTVLIFLFLDPGKENDRSSLYLLHTTFKKLEHTAVSGFGILIMTSSLTEYHDKK